MPGWTLASRGTQAQASRPFVNAIRGLADKDPKSAYTGMVEMTVGPTPYAHPKYPNVVIWDLPGIGVPTFQAKKYLQRVLPARYDFIIISLDSFAAHHAQLARELQQRGKRFYLIRSKVDVDIAASRSRPRGCSVRSGMTAASGWRVRGRRWGAGAGGFWRGRLPLPAKVHSGERGRPMSCRVTELGPAVG